MMSWSADWAWSLPLILVTVVIHVFGLGLINERVVRALSRSIDHREQRAGEDQRKHDPADRHRAHDLTSGIEAPCDPLQSEPERGSENRPPQVDVS